VSGYTGSVRQGGDPAVRDLGSVTISKRSVGEMDNNAYLVTDTATGRQLLVDAAQDASVLLSWVDTSALDVVVTTHRHHDHIGALADVAAAAPSARLASGRADADAIEQATGVTIDERLADGDRLRFGESAVTAITLVGHTPGSVALAFTDGDGRTHVFTGDSLFPGGVGRTAGPSEFSSLLGDVTAKLFDVFPDDTWVYPGHGADTTLGAERPALPDWKARGW
jgi:glyoxylase-like metal-dependent hydrolase (beta-lactamase superfamily II)